MTIYPTSISFEMFFRFIMFAIVRHIKQTGKALLMYVNKVNIALVITIPFYILIDIHWYLFC